MNKFVFFLFLSLLLLSQLDSSKSQDRKHWSWGTVDDDNSTKDQINQRAQESTSTDRAKRKLTDDEIRAMIDECGPYEPAVPDFSKPGRRLSEVKCLETIWDIQYRKTAADRSLTCTVKVAKAKGYTIQAAIGGRDANDGEFPHMGAVGWVATNGTWIFKCGATLISAKFVLTAAHCTRVSSLDTTVNDTIPKIVRLGDKNILDTISRFSNQPVDDAIISKIIKHPSYQSPKRYNDIAIMELEKPVKFTYQVHPACLWVNQDTSRLGSQATVTGWGVIETAGLKRSPILQAAVVDTIDQNQCDSLLRGSCNRLWCGLQEHQLCAGKLEGGVDACQGDSGGPLQVKLNLPRNATEESMYYVIGVTSFGIGCARANTPGVYTRISSYIDWIEQTVWGVN